VALSLPNHKASRKQDWVNMSVDVFENLRCLYQLSFHAMLFIHVGQNIVLRDCATWNFTVPNEPIPCPVHWIRLHCGNINNYHLKNKEKKTFFKVFLPFKRHYYSN